VHAAPPAAAYVPAPHARQAEALDVEYWPEAQSKHAVAANPEYLPAAQAAQSAASDEPVAALARPAPHWAHADAPVEAW